MKTKRRKVVVIVLVLLLISVVFTGFSSQSLSAARNVDILKVFTSGVLTGVLISMLSAIYRERKNPEAF